MYRVLPRTHLSYAAKLRKVHAHSAVPTFRIGLRRRLTGTATQPLLQLLTVPAAAFVDRRDAGIGAPAKRAEQPDSQRQRHHDREQQSHHDGEVANSDQMADTEDGGRHRGDEGESCRHVGEHIEIQPGSGSWVVRHESEPSADAYIGRKEVLSGVFAPCSRLGRTGLRRLAGDPDEREQTAHPDDRAGRRSRVPAADQSARRPAQVLTRSDRETRCQSAGSDRLRAPGNPSATAAANSSRDSRVCGRSRSRLISAPSSRWVSNGT